MFNSIGLDTDKNCTSRAACDCVKKAVYDAWGSTFRNAYPSWGALCLSENCALTEWKDPQTGNCRRKALLAVLASTEVSVVNMALIKSEEVRTVSQTIELRLDGAAGVCHRSRLLGDSLPVGRRSVERKGAGEVKLAAADQVQSVQQRVADFLLRVLR